MYESPHASVWKRHLEALLAFVFPTPCLGCPELAPAGLRGLGLCCRCRARIRPLRPPVCRLCSQPLQAARTSGDFICLACRRAPKTVDRLLALWSYEEPVDAIIRALKFSGHIGLAAPLAGLMAERLREVGVIPDIIAPVPLHWTRRLTRGYDQSQEIARHLSRRLGVRLGQPLRRHRRTRAQSRLPRARRGGNLFRAFSANRRRDATGQRVLLVDDVVTSGATLRAAAARLRSMGAHSIVAVVVARTPEPGENILQPLAALRRF